MFGYEAWAEDLYGQVLPYEDSFATASGTAMMGSMARLLGLLATTCRRWDDAERHFEHALEANRRIRAPIWVAWTQFNYADMLVKCRDALERGRALSLLSDALATAHELGLKRLLDRALPLKMELEGTASVDAKTSIDSVADSVEAKKPDLRPHAAPDGTVTIMFSDMEGFSSMTERLGDREAHKVIQAHNAIVREQLKAHGGYEVELQGDGFLLAFASASHALQCAIAIQRAFSAHSAEHPEQPIRVRIGLHTGEPIKEADRFFGKTVILAARIASEAQGEEIFVSSLVKELASGASDFVFDGGQETELKGLSGTYDVYELLWDGREPRRKPTEMRAVPALAGNAFIREGDFWTIAYDRKSVRLHDMKGLHSIAHLLRHAGQEFHVADLATVGKSGTDAPALTGKAEPTDVQVARGLGDAGEILDSQARAQYKERLESLRAEFEEAKSFNDTGRIATIQEEIDFLSGELSAAYGLGGRDKKAADSAERIRKTVTSRIRQTLERIEKEHRELGLHFSRAIRTGTYCSYNPEKPTSWQL
jgi:class 3 adenylate cyclase